MMLLTPLIITLHLQLKLRRKTKYLHKHFSSYLANENSGTVFLPPTDKEEISSIISCVNPNSVSGSNSIPYRFILKRMEC